MSDDLNDNLPSVSELPYLELDKDERNKILDITKRDQEIRLEEIRQQGHLDNKALDNSRHEVELTSVFYEKVLSDTTSRLKFVVLLIILPVLLLFFGFIFFALYLDHVALVKDVSIFVIGAVTGLLGGYGFGKTSSSSD